MEESCAQRGQIGAGVGRAVLLAPSLLGLAVFGALAAGSGADATKRAEADALNAAILSHPADADYGAYLASECVTCHRASGRSDGIPPIAGLPAGYLVNALVEYRVGIRDNDVMAMRAAALGDAEIAALAAHFSAQRP